MFWLATELGGFAQSKFIVLHIIFAVHWHHLVTPFSVTGVNNNNNKRSLFMINLINCTIYLPKGREFKKISDGDKKIKYVSIVCNISPSHLAILHVVIFGRSLS